MDVITSGRMVHTREALHCKHTHTHVRTIEIGPEESNAPQRGCPETLQDPNKRDVSHLLRKLSNILRTSPPSARSSYIFTLLPLMGSEHPSPNVKTFCNFEPQTWPEIVTSRDAESACFKGPRTSCDVIILGICWPILAGKDHIT